MSNHVYPEAGKKFPAAYLSAIHVWSSNSPEETNLSSFDFAPLTIEGSKCGDLTGLRER